jgi:hypothetical protein
MTITEPKWYAAITRYQWLVLIIASLGWIFDAFEGQIYNITRADLLPELLHVHAADPLVKLWGERFLGAFLIGGTLGGWLFSSLADRWGRNPVLALTILCYSIFSGLTAFATEIWQVGVLRFLVAMGVGGEWAVGAALVAEVFPKGAREPRLADDARHGARERDGVRRRNQACDAVVDELERAAGVGRRDHGFARKKRFERDVAVVFVERRKDDCTGAGV